MKPVVASGWGTRNPDKIDLPAILNMVELKTTDGSCGQVLGKSKNYQKRLLSYRYVCIERRVAHNKVLWIKVWVGWRV